MEIHLLFADFQFTRHLVLDWQSRGYGLDPRILHNLKFSPTLQSCEDFFTRINDSNVDRMFFR